VRFEKPAFRRHVEINAGQLILSNGALPNQLYIRSRSSRSLPAKKELKLRLRACAKINSHFAAGPQAGRRCCSLLDDGTASPASRRLASARPALASKCEVIFARALSYLQKMHAIDCHSARRECIGLAGDAFRAGHRISAGNSVCTMRLKTPDRFPTVILRVLLTRAMIPFYSARRYISADLQ